MSSPIRSHVNRLVTSGLPRQSVDLWSANLRAAIGLCTAVRPGHDSGVPDLLPNAFVGRAEAPTPDAVKAALGPAHEAWTRWLSELARDHGADVHEWKTYSVKAGWSLRVIRKKRTIVWLSPSVGAFNVLFILGEKAVAAAKAARLPAPIHHALAAAPRYPEGTGLRWVVRSARSLPALTKLAAIKVAN